MLHFPWLLNVVCVYRVLEGSCSQCALQLGYTSSTMQLPTSRRPNMHMACLGVNQCQVLRRNVSVKTGSLSRLQQWYLDSGVHVYSGFYNLPELLLVVRVDLHFARG